MKKDRIKIGAYSPITTFDEAHLRSAMIRKKRRTFISKTRTI